MHMNRFYQHILIDVIRSLCGWLDNFRLRHTLNGIIRDLNTELLHLPIFDLRDLDSGPSQSAESFLQHCIEAHFVCLFLLFKLISLFCLGLRCFRF